MPSGFVYDPRYLAHQPGRGHPERSERLSATLTHLESRSWFPRLLPVAARPADDEWLQSVHDPAYVSRAEEACRRGARQLDVPDVGICEASEAVARLAAGAGLALADRMIAGEIRNGFSLSRPPGHHAERALALGFCLFNNIAILARYLQRRHGLERVAILDWDVHHGNGTQHCFEADPDVLYLSLHQFPYYPGTGAAGETGTGPGEGATVNCPMPAGAGDEAYQEAFRRRILPALEAFAPEAVLVSAGFDAHRADPLADIRLTTECFRWMSERVAEVAEQHASGRVISLLEGGYSLEALPLSVAAHLEVLLEAAA